MPLVPRAPGGSSSAAAAEVYAPVEERLEDVAADDAYLELVDPGEDTVVVRRGEEEVVSEKPKKIKKKRLIKQSDVLPAKKLRTDHPSLASGTGRKTLAGLEQIMPAGSRLLAREQSATPSVAPPSQESESFVDLSAQASLQICTTVGSTLSAPVDTAAATTTSTKAKLAADVNLDMAGPSQLEEPEGSDDYFYELATFDPSEAKHWYVSRWNITNDSLLDDSFSCRTLVDRVAPPAFFSSLRSMDCDQLYTEFNVGAVRQTCLGSEVRSRAEHELELKEKLNAKYAARGKLLEEKDSEILRLKYQLAEKEAEAAEVVRLRNQVSSLSGEKSALTAEVSALKVTITQKDHDISLLDSRATHLESALNDAQVACTEAGTKITSLASERDRLVSEVSSLRAGFKDFKEKMEVQQEEQAQELYNRVAELEAHVMDGILGHALGRAVDFGMQEGLEAGHEHGVAGRSLSMVDAYNPEAARASYVDAVKALEDASFLLVDSLKSKKDARMDEVLDYFLLYGPLVGLPKAAYLQPCIEQLSVPIHHAGDKTAVGETSLSFALMNVHARAKGAKKHAAALRQLMMEIFSAPLSSQTWVGEASTSATPLSVEDYTEEDTDEALGSVVAVPKLECLELTDLDEGTAMVRQSEEESATPSVAHPSQESASFVDLSAQASLQICTTVGSSSTLSAPVDTAAATTTSTKAKLAADVNPDLAGPSQLEESEGSDDSFYELATLDPSEAKRWYVPRWNITNDSLLDDGFSCRTLVDRVAPPAFFSSLRSMDCDQLYTEFNVGAARQICLGSEVRSRAEHELELKEKLNAKYAARGKLLEEKDSEILRLKSQLAEKEAEAAEVVRLRNQVSSLSGEKSALTAEVSALKVTITQKDHDISLLDSRATHLESALNDAQVACTEAGTKITSLASERDRLVSEVSSLRAGFEDFKEKMEVQQEEQAQELYNRVAKLEAGRRWLLTHGIQLALLKCLKSSEYQGILGHALGLAVDFGMQEDYVNAVKALEDAHFPLVDLLKSKKDAGMDEVLDCFLLDGPLAELTEAASLQLCIEQLSIPIHHADDKTAVGETSISFALMNVHARAEGGKKHAMALRQLMMEIVSAPLSSQTWVGEASISAALISVEDYVEEDTDEALGSVIAIPHLDRCCL
ncbi:gypsy type transposase [Tanacetum coccineum]